MIYTAYHIDAPMVSGFYKPVHVGKAISDKVLDMDSDICENGISEKNRLYSELTLFKYIEQVGNEDILGLTHYRRGFLFDGGLDTFKKKFGSNSVDYLYGKKALPFTQYTKEKFEFAFDSEIAEYYTRKYLIDEGYDYIVQQPYEKENKFGFFTMSKTFDIPIKTLVLFMEHLEKTTSRYMYETCINFMLNNKTQYVNNIVIAKNEDFKEYSKWLLDILMSFEVELRKIDESLIVPRLFGYISEFMLKSYIEYKRVSKDVKVKFVDNICFENLKTDSRV